MKTYPYHNYLSFRTAAIMLAIAGSAAAQNTYTWDGGGADDSWGTADNWGGGTKTWNVNALANFHAVGARIPTTIITGGVRSMRELRFNADADGDIIIDLNTGNNMNFLTSPAGNSRITVLAGAEGNFEIKSSANMSVNAGKGSTGEGTDMTIEHNGSGTLLISARYAQSGTLYKEGTGTLELAGNNTGFTGSTVVAGGTLRATGSAFASSGIAISSGATFSFANASGTLGYHNNTTNHQISGAGTLMKEGAGVVELSADGRGTTISMSSGALIDIQGGTLRNGQWNNAVWTDNLADLNIAAGATFDTWNGAPIRVNALTGSGGIVNGLNGGETSLTLGVDDGSGIFSGGISAIGLSLIKAGTGTQELAASSSFTGNITIDGGTLQAGAGNALGQSSASRTITVNNGGTLDFRVGDVFSGHTNANVPALVINQGGTVTNATNHNPLGSVTLNGGSLTATSGWDGLFRSWCLNGTVTSTGDSTISDNPAGNGSGVLLQSTGAPGDTPSNTDFDVQSGTLNISARIYNGLGSDIVEHVSSLTKQGSGTLILAGANTYTGATNVSAGTLLVTGQLGATNVSVGGGALIGGDGTLGGNLHFGSGAGLVFSLTDTLTVNGSSVSFAGFSIANLSGFGNEVPVGTYFLLDGDATVNTANLGNLGAGSAFIMGDTGKQAYFETGSLNLVVVPEPRAALLGGLGLLALLRRCRG